MSNKWKYIDVVRATNGTVYILECSNCGKRTVVSEPPTVLREDLKALWKSIEFCPSCNADMRSEEYIAEMERKKTEEDDLIERIADRVVQGLSCSPVAILCNELPETGEPGHIYVVGIKQYVWQEDMWLRIN